LNKIIIHNKTSLTDSECLAFVDRVISKGKISGDIDKGTEQYCYVSTFSYKRSKFVVVARRRKNTHTFKVLMEAKNELA